MGERPRSEDGAMDALSDDRDSRVPVLLHRSPDEVAVGAQRVIGELQPAAATVPAMTETHMQERQH